MAIMQVGRAVSDRRLLLSVSVDFINAWNVDILQKATDQCTNDSGRIEDCGVLETHDLNTAAYTDSPTCRKTTSVNELVTGNLEKLPGNNPIQKGPDNAAMHEDPDPPSTFSRRE